MLVTGASGGLGVSTRSRRRRTLPGHASSPFPVPRTRSERLEYEFGCETVSWLVSLDFAEIALALTEDEGVDVVIDTVGSPTFLVRPSQRCPSSGAWCCSARSRVDVRNSISRN